MTLRALPAPNHLLPLALSLSLSLSLASCDDHEHEAAHSHGAPHTLGLGDLGGATFEVTLNGSVDVGSECSVDVVLKTGAERVRAVRAWIGNRAGDGTIRRRLEGEGTLHVHIEIPAGLPADSALWIEVETTAGERLQQSFALPD